MTKTIIVSLTLALSGTALAQMPGKQLNTNPSIQIFWEKFRAAVIKGDKIGVANLSAFPISMPYGMRDVKTKAQLIKRYRDVFNSETSAAKCFSKAQPETDPARKKEFTVACSLSDASEGKPLVYTFILKRNGWRFSSFDNINE